MAVVAMVAAGLVVQRLSRRLGLQPGVAVELTVAAVIGGLAGAIVLARLRRLPLGLIANVMAPAVAVGYAVARVGCLLAGDGTYGRSSDLPWAMAFPRGMMPTTARVQPTALYETLAMLVVFIVLY